MRKYIVSVLYICALVNPIAAQSATTELWEYFNGSWYDRTTYYDGVNTLDGSIKQMDGGYVANDYTVTNLYGGVTRTFTDKIIGISENDLSNNNFLVALESGDLWGYVNGSWYDRTTYYDGVNSLNGGIKQMDGYYVADDYTVTSLWGDATRTFTDKIIGISESDFSNNNFLVALAPVPIPSAVWLFGSGLIGLIGMARRKKS